MKLPEKLAYLRKGKDLSQYDVASTLNVSRQAISRWESGSSVPSTENLKGLSVLYDVSVDFLLDEEQDQPDRGKKGGHEEDTSYVLLRTTTFMKRYAGWICSIFILFIVVIVFFLHYREDTNKEDSVLLGETEVEKLDPDGGSSFLIEW